MEIVDRILVLYILFFLKMKDKLGLNNLEQIWKLLFSEIQWILDNKWKDLTPEEKLLLCCENEEDEN